MELVGKHAPGAAEYVELLGMRPLLTEPGHMRLEFRGRASSLNPAGLVQGGFVTAMLDETMGTGGDRAARPGAHDPDARAEGQLPAAHPTGPARVRRARRAHGQVGRLPRGRRSRDDDGNLVATATATARVVKLGERGSDDLGRARARDRRAAVARARWRASVGRPAAGAIVTFQGTTRDVDSLEYEAYREMAEERIAAIVAEAIARHGLEAAAAEHRVGTRAAGRGERRGRGVRRAPRRGVRGRARDHRPHQGRGADLEEGGRGGRGALGRRDSPGKRCRIRTTAGAALGRAAAPDRAAALGRRRRGRARWRSTPRGASSSGAATRSCARQRRPRRRRRRSPSRAAQRDAARRGARRSAP